jgi:hypothetical protein
MKHLSLLAFASALAIASGANAMIAPFGGAATGTDPLGHTWVTTNSGAPSWGEPGRGRGTLSFNPAGNADVTGNTWANRFSFIFLEGVGGSIDQTPAVGPGGFELTTRFSTGGILWNEQFVGNNKVIFTAPTGVKINQGDSFFVNISFTGPVDLNKFSFAGLWTDVGTGVPEPATWALMLGGFGLAGVALRRRRTVAA